MKGFEKFLVGSVRVCLIATLSVGVGGWDHYCGCEGTEFVTRGVGDAVQTNKEIQMITPWPPYVHDRTLNFDGRRASIAIRRYQHDAIIPPVPLSAQMAKEQTNYNGYNPPPPEGKQ